MCCRCIAPSITNKFAAALLGIIRKQAFLGTLVNYLGIAIGYLNVVVVLPAVLSTEEFGLTRTLMSMAAILAQLASLGFGRSMLKFFPFFKTDDKRHRGFLFLSLVVPLLGFALLCIFYLVFAGLLKAQFAENSALFVRYYLLVLPFTFLWLFSDVVEIYLQSLHRTVFTSLLKNVLVRVLWLGEGLAFAAGWLSFDQFIWLFVLTYSGRLVLSLLVVVNMGQFHPFPHHQPYRRLLVKRMAGYSLFSVVAGGSIILVEHIDKVMISSMLGLEAIGTYAVASYLCALIITPAQALVKVATPVLSQALRNKDVARVQRIYGQSAEMNLVVGGTIFLVLWLNAENLLSIANPAYAKAANVVLFVGLARLAHMAFGCNGAIASLARVYKFDVLASALLIGSTVGLNLLLIPRFGMVGAGISLLGTMLVYNSALSIFLHRRLGIQPFSFRLLKIAAMLGAVWLVVALIPALPQSWADVALRAALVPILFFVPLLWLRLSPEVNRAATDLLSRLKSA